MYIRLHKAFLSYVLIFNQGGLFCYDVLYSPELPGGMLFIKTRPKLRETCSRMDRTFQVQGVQKNWGSSQVGTLVDKVLPHIKRESEHVFFT